MINNVEAKWPGSVHDSRMFRESTLSARFARGEFIYLIYIQYIVISYDQIFCFLLLQLKQ